MIAKMNFSPDRSTTPFLDLGASTRSFVSLEQRINQWIRAYPVMSLTLAATAGAALGWLIKPAR
jgi:hypothetical protein